LSPEHTTKTGAPKIFDECTLPITGFEVVDMSVTELAVIRVTAEGLVLEEVAPGVIAQEVQRVTVPKLQVAQTLAEMAC
jgi:acyl CoA:acetate/3-ketoacid CoA transferase beta subunit